MGWPKGSQWLNSPATETLPASGAKKLKLTLFALIPFDVFVIFCLLSYSMISLPVIPSSIGDFGPPSKVSLKL
jgi:hypothetical protein